jgi:cyclic pyranopterin phosphate synthase
VPVLDAHARPLRSLRLSVTDRCNLRCRYCMPQAHARWLPRAELLTFDEIGGAVGLLSALGVRRVRLTGGEPLMRRDLPALVARLTAQSGIDDLALTTNGTRLAPLALPLRAAGLGRVTVSLDTLDRRRFEAITGTDGLDQVLAGIDAALAAGLRPVKLDTVVLQGTNDREIADILQMAWARGLEPRLIEYMPVGHETTWKPAEALRAAEMLEAITRRFGPVRPGGPQGASPARAFELEDGRRFGIVAANSAPFCGRCDRARLTADGMLLGCLHDRHALDLKSPLRAGASPSELSALVERWWSARRSRGAEQRARGSAPLSGAKTAREPGPPSETTDLGAAPPMHRLGG